MKKVLTLSIISLLLTACGSGGGKGGSANSGNTYVPPTKVNTSLSQASLELREQIKKIKAIRINDQNIDLANEPTGFLVRDTSDKTTARVYNQVYSVLGYIQPKFSTDNRVERLKQVIDLNKIKDGNEYYANLVATNFDNIPTSESATYSGIAMAQDLEGKLTLNADFTNKKVSGEITQVKQISSGETKPDYKLQETDIAKIALPNTSRELHFAGIALSDGERFGYGGTFAGPEAEEVLGMLAKDNKIKLQFIGKK